MIALLVVAAALQAASAPTPAPTAVTTSTKPRCKRIAETGSYVRATRICHTEEEWRAIERGNSLEMDRLRDRTPINSQRPVG